MNKENMRTCKLCHKRIEDREIYEEYCLHCYLKVLSYQEYINELEEEDNYTFF